MSLQLICYFCLENNSVQNDHKHSILPAGIPIWPNLFAFSSCYGDVAFKSNQNSENFGTELSGMEISGEKWILTVCISLGSGIVRSLQIVKRLLRRNTWKALEREIARHRLLCLYSSCSSSVYFPQVAFSIQKGGGPEELRGGSLIFYPPKKGGGGRHKFDPTQRGLLHRFTYYSKVCI